MLKYLSFFLVILFPVVVAAEQPLKNADNRIAVFDLQITGDLDKNISHPLTESIRRALVLSGKYEVMDRGNMNKILEENRNFKYLECPDKVLLMQENSLAWEKFVVGSVGIIGKTYLLSLSLINAQTGKIENAAEDKCKCEVDGLIDSSKNLTQRLLGNDKQDALNRFANITKWGSQGDSYRNFKRELEKLIELNQSGEWFIGWGLTKDGKPYHLRWMNNEFYNRAMTMDEATDKKLGKNSIKLGRPKDGWADK